MSDPSTEGHIATGAVRPLQRGEAHELANVPLQSLLAAFRQAGFVLVEESIYGRKEPDAATLAALLPRFAGLSPDDLSITGAVVAFRLPS